MRLIAIIFLSLSIMGFKLSAQTARLTLVKKFPDYNSQRKGEYLVHPLDVEKYKDLYYVSDYVDNSIKIFSQEGRLVKVIASEGHGPGEVIQPNELAIDRVKQKLYCVDQGNGRIVIFTKDGTYLASFRNTMSRLRALAADNGRSFASTKSKKTNTIFRMYNGDGGFIKYFGESWNRKINKLKYRDFLYSEVDMRIYQDSLYIFFNMLPVIRVYDRDGRFARQIDVKVNFAENAYRHNLNSGKVTREKNILHFKDWMRGAVIDNGIFYCFALREGYILALDQDGNLLKKIKFEKDEPIEAYKSRRLNCKVGNDFIFSDLASAQILVYELRYE